MTIIISLNVTCSRHDIAEKFLILALNNNHFDFFLWLFFQNLFSGLDIHSISVRNADYFSNINIYWTVYLLEEENVRIYDDFWQKGKY